MSIVDVVTLLNTAGLGFVAWLLLAKVDVRISSMERAVNRFVRVSALELARSPRTSPGVRREAKQLLRELADDGDRAATLELDVDVDQGAAE